MKVIPQRLNPDRGRRTEAVPRQGGINPKLRPANRLLPRPLHLRDRRRLNGLGIHLLSLRVVCHVIASRDIGNLSPVALLSRRHRHLWRGSILHASLHAGIYRVTSTRIHALQALDRLASLDSRDTPHSWHCIHVFICHVATHW